MGQVLIMKVWCACVCEGARFTTALARFDTRAERPRDVLRVLRVCVSACACECACVCVYVPLLRVRVIPVREVCVCVRTFKHVFWVL